MANATEALKAEAAQLLSAAAVVPPPERERTVSAAGQRMKGAIFLHQPPNRRESYCRRRTLARLNCQLQVKRDG